jgi:hypothetical protein
MHKLIIDEEGVTLTSYNAGNNWNGYALGKHTTTGLIYHLVWDHIPCEAVQGGARKLMAFLKDNKPDAIGITEEKDKISISEIELIEIMN